MLTLNINKLRNEVEEREKKKIKIFEKVLDMTFKKIIHSNQNYNDYYCMFTVPNVVFGLPLYDVGECCKFIIEKLIEKGFEVYLAIPTTLHISWKPKDRNNNSYNNSYTPQLQYYNYDNENNYNNSLDTSSNKSIAINYKNQYKNENKNERISQKSNQNYRPIDDYKQNVDTIYDTNDLDLFKNKLDNLFN